MSKPDLHIISFAVPFPAMYGGAIDVLNRLKALNQAGLRIHLHSFVYGDFKPHDALTELAKEVYYYPRITWPALLAPGIPYIVSSRRNPVLLKRLNEDDAPVLFEGIHTTGFCEQLNKRKMLLRAHNIEYQYYDHLARESQRFQYLFFQRESLALERYECNNARNFDAVFAISPPDQDWYTKKGGKSEFMPVYHGLNEVDIKPGRGTYLLYQGDLSIMSNQNSVLEFIRSMPGIDHFPLVIAGKSGDKSFEESLTKYPNLRREMDVSDSRMTELIRDAQVVIVHSRNPAGMKVKLFPALFFGRFIMANRHSLTGTPLDKEFHVYESSKQISSLLDKLWTLEFNHQHLRDRIDILRKHPTDNQKAQALIQHL